MNETLTKPTTFVTIPVRCIICGKDTKLHLDINKYFNWRSGAGSIQVIFPELTDNERELLVTGLCNDHQPS